MVVGAVLFSNAPPQTSNNVNMLSFSYTVSNNTFTFYAAEGFTGYTWDFGNSSIGAGSVISHTYQTNGNYQVTLTADLLTGPSGSLSAVHQVLVSTVTTLIRHYFENLNVTVGSAAKRPLELVETQSGSTSYFSQPHTRTITGAHS